MGRQGVCRHQGQVALKRLGLAVTSGHTSNTERAVVLLHAKRIGETRETRPLVRSPSDHGRVSRIHEKKKEKEEEEEKRSQLYCKKTSVLFIPSLTTMIGLYIERRRNKTMAFYA